MKFSSIIYFIPKMFGYFLKLVEYGYLSSKAFEFIKQVNVCFISAMKNPNKIRHIYSMPGRDNVEFNTYQEYYAILGEFLIYEVNKVPGMTDWLVNRLHAEDETGEHYIEFLIEGELDFRGNFAKDYFEGDNIIELLKEQCMQGTIVEDWFKSMNITESAKMDLIDDGSFDKDDQTYFDTFSKDDQKRKQIYDNVVVPGLIIYEQCFSYYEKMAALRNEYGLDR